MACNGNEFLIQQLKSKCRIRQPRKKTLREIVKSYEKPVSERLSQKKGRPEDEYENWDWVKNKNNNPYSVKDESPVGETLLWAEPHMEGRHFVNPFADALHDMIKQDLPKKLRNRLDRRKDIFNDMFNDDQFKKPMIPASSSTPLLKIKKDSEKSTAEESRQEQGFDAPQESAAIPESSSIEAIAAIKELDMNQKKIEPDLREETPLSPEIPLVEWATDGIKSIFPENQKIKDPVDADLIEETEEMKDARPEIDRLPEAVELKDQTKDKNPDEVKQQDDGGVDELFPVKDDEKNEDPGSSESVESGCMMVNENGERIFKPSFAEDSEESDSESTIESSKEDLAEVTEKPLISVDSNKNFVEPDSGFQLEGTSGDFRGPNTPWIDLTIEPEENTFSSPKIVKQEEDNEVQRQRDILVEKLLVRNFIENPSPLSRRKNAPAGSLQSPIQKSRRRLVLDPRPHQVNPEPLKIPQADEDQLTRCQEYAKDMPSPYQNPTRTFPGQTTPLDRIVATRKYENSFENLHASSSRSELKRMKEWADNQDRLKKKMKLNK